MKRADEPISVILKETGTVTTFQGPWRGFFIMVLALLISRRKWPWLAITAACYGGARWYGVM